MFTYGTSGVPEGIGDTLLRIEHDRLAYAFYGEWEEEFKGIDQLKLLTDIAYWIRNNKV